MSATQLERSSGTTRREKLFVVDDGKDGAGFASREGQAARSNKREALLPSTMTEAEPASAMAKTKSSLFSGSYHDFLVKLRER